MINTPPVTGDSGAQDLAEPLSTGGSDIAWRSFFTRLIAAFACLLTVAALVIGLTNPYGNLPNTLFKKHIIAQRNQRFQYPAITRSGNFDSVLIGTSTSGILRPPRLNDVLGGKFANLAMDSARAWEQTQVTNLFRRHAGPDARLIIGIDIVWCDLDANSTRTTERGFPEWMYDENPWNDFPAMFNATSLEYGLKQFLVAAGLKSPRMSDDGYKVFLPDESAYDIQKSATKSYLGTASPTQYPSPFRR